MRAELRRGRSQRVSQHLSDLFVDDVHPARVVAVDGLTLDTGNRVCRVSAAAHRTAEHLAVHGTAETLHLAQVLSGFVVGNLRSVSRHVAHHLGSVVLQIAGPLAQLPRIGESSPVTGSSVGAPGMNLLEGPLPGARQPIGQAGAAVASGAAARPGPGRARSVPAHRRGPGRTRDPARSRPHP
jgi:hypothetical protein